MHLPSDYLFGLQHIVLSIYHCSSSRMLLVSKSGLRHLPGGCQGGECQDTTPSHLPSAISLALQNIVLSVIIARHQDGTSVKSGLRHLPGGCQGGGVPRHDPFASALSHLFRPSNFVLSSYQLLVIKDGTSVSKVASGICLVVVRGVECLNTTLSHLPSDHLFRTSEYAAPYHCSSSRCY